MNKYIAVCDKVIALIPAEKDGGMVGVLHLPPGARKAAMDKNPVAQMTLHSVGPECKTARAGDVVLYNRHHVDGLPCPDGELIIIPEGQILAIVREAEGDTPAKELEPTVIGKPVPSATQLTVDEIRKSLQADNKIAEQAPDA